jgi:hypothetical protein
VSGVTTGRKGLTVFSKTAKVQRRVDWSAKRLRSFVGKQDGGEKSLFSQV